MIYIGRIDLNIYNCISQNITSDEVIINDTQIRHIKQRHGNDYDLLFQFLPDTVANPDYILRANRPDSAVILKSFRTDNGKIQLILRLATTSDPSGYKNSIITLMKIGNKSWSKLLRNKDILYKRPGI